MKSVLVLLSTYNGEKYLKEQLNSIYCQKDVDVHLLVRDDCSTDRTIQILQDYKNSHGKMHLYQGENVGAAYSFFKLLQLATESNETFDYYCYSDQDDVWFEDKIISSVKGLEKSDSIYKMAYCDLCTTDEDLNPYNENRSRHRVYDLYSNIVSNHIAGCCQLFNLELLLELNKINDNRIYRQYPQIPFLHDSWTSIVAFSLNAYIYHDENPRMYYRQHENNAIGNVVGGVVSLYKARILRYIKPAIHSKSAKCVCLKILIWDIIPDENKPFISMVANYRSSILKKIKILISPHLYVYGWGENIGAFLLVLLNKF